MTVYDPRNVSPSSSPEGVVQVIDAEDAAEFAKIRKFQVGLEMQTPSIVMTFLFVAINAIMFAVMVGRGVSATSPEAVSLLKWGANHGLLTMNGDWWRLLTCTIIHIGLFHLFINLYSLWVIGPAVEKLFQPSGFFALYFLSGLGGSLVSTWWQPMVTSAGASGAIFGVFGALMGYAFKQKHTLPHSIFVRLRNNGILILGINLLIGMNVEGIDMAGHMGGMVVGFLVALVLALPVDAKLRRVRFLRSLLTLAVGSVLLASAFFLIPREATKKPLALLKLRQRLSPSWNSQDMQKFRSASREFQANEKRLMRIFQTAYRDVLTRKITEKDFLSRLEKDVLAPWKKLDRLLNVYSVKNLPVFAQKRHRLLRLYVRRKAEYLSALSKGLRSKALKDMAATQKKRDAMLKVLNQLNKK